MTQGMSYSRFTGHGDTSFCVQTVPTIVIYIYEPKMFVAYDITNTVTVGGYNPKKKKLLLSVS